MDGGPFLPCRKPPEWLGKTSMSSGIGWTLGCACASARVSLRESSMMRDLPVFVGPSRTPLEKLRAICAVPPSSDRAPLEFAR